MRQIVQDVYVMERLRGCNVYLLVSGEGLTLVDSGLPDDAARIEAQLREGGWEPSAVRTIVLTHAHADHMGGAAELARRSGAAILAHRDEAPYIERIKSLPPRSFAQRIMGWLAGRLMPRPSPCKVDRVVGDGDVIDALGGMRVMHTPGHTPGSISLYQPERRILICSDTLFNKNPLTGRAGLRLSIPLFTADMAQARESARKLSALPVDVLCCGHGEPILEGAGRRMEALLQSTAA